MVFYPPSWVPPLPIDPPDSVSIEQFMTGHVLDLYPLAQRRNPFTCGITGRTHSWEAMQRRVGLLAAALSRRLGWRPDDDNTPWHKVVAVFSLNTIDYVTAIYAVHRLDGIATPANAAYSAAELQHQLQAAGAQAMFTCLPLLATARQAAAAVGIPDERIFLLDLPVPTSQKEALARAAAVHTTVDALIEEAALSSSSSVGSVGSAGSAGSEETPPLKWPPRQGARQTALVCFSSGTSGLPKGVMISHRNVIANVLQQTTHETVARRRLGIVTQVEVGLLPFSHIYGLVVIAHTGVWRGDEVVVLPKFDLHPFLKAIQTHRIEQLRIVPPILIRLLQSQDEVARYDLRSVRFLYTGAAPTGEETVAALQQLYPSWKVGQGYGMTETATVVCSTSEHDILPRSSGSLIPGTRAKIIGFDGREVTSYDTPGELLVQSPSVALGYLHNEKATDETFVYHVDGSGRWIRTGDEAVITVSESSGHEHVVIVDRIKELIKVKGHQVAPAELEAHLLVHPAVADVAVIQVPDDRAGEVPKAFVVLAEGVTPTDDLVRDIAKHVEVHKAPYKWLKGGIEFLDAIPKSPSGKILRRLLRDRERASRRKTKL